MTDYVYNKLTIIGNYTDLHTFYTENQDKDGNLLSFNTQIPVSNKITELCDINWGCKYDAFDVQARLHSDILIYIFKTRLSYPKIWLEKISARYPNLAFYNRYQDSLFASFGYVKCMNGTTIILEDYGEEDILDYIVFHNHIYPEELIRIADNNCYTPKMKWVPPALISELDNYLSERIDNYYFNAFTILPIIDKLMNERFQNATALDL